MATNCNHSISWALARRGSKLQTVFLPSCAWPALLRHHRGADRPTEPRIRCQRLWPRGSPSVGRKWRMAGFAVRHGREALPSGRRSTGCLSCLSLELEPSPRKCSRDTSFKTPPTSWRCLSCPRLIPIGPSILKLHSAHLLGLQFTPADAVTHLPASAVLAMPEHRSEQGHREQRRRLPR